MQSDCWDGKCLRYSVLVAIGTWSLKMQSGVAISQVNECVTLQKRAHPTTDHGQYECRNSLMNGMQRILD